MSAPSGIFVYFLKKIKRRKWHQRYMLNPNYFFVFNDRKLSAVLQESRDNYYNCVSLSNFFMRRKFAFAFSR